MLKILVLILIYILICESFNNNNKNIINDEINCLNKLSLNELLKIHKSLIKLQSSTSEIKEISSEISEEIIIESKILDDNKQILALPLVGGINKFFNGNKNMDRSYENINEHHHHQMWEKPKPTKLETVFQLSITALSFLAFGGYLLCMIVQAIKSKGTTYYHPVAGGSSMMTNNNNNNNPPLKKIKVYRRQRRTILTKPKIIPTNKNSTTNTKFYNDQMALPNPNDMYKILILFTEGYVKLIDIK